MPPSVAKAYLRQAKTLLDKGQLEQCHEVCPPTHRRERKFLTQHD